MYYIPAEEHASAHTSADAERNFNALLALFSVEEEIETAGAHARKLAQNDVFRNTTQRIDFCMAGCFQQHVHRFLERASHQSASILPSKSGKRNCQQLQFTSNKFKKNNTCLLIPWRVMAIK